MTISSDNVDADSIAQPRRRACPANERTGLSQQPQSLAGVAFAAPFAGPVSTGFEFVPLSARQMGAVIAIVMTYSAMTEVAKYWFYGRKYKFFLPALRDHAA